VTGHGHGPDRTSDTAGVPWHGRDLRPNPFAGDDGRADPALVAALDAAAGGAGSVAEVVRVLATTRVLVPVSAVLGEDDPLPDHVRGDLGADMAVAIVAGPDGRSALPVFTSLDAMARWDPAARPVPVQSSRAALSAVDEGCDLLVLDPAGPVRFVVPRPAVWALGQGRPWTPPGDDPELLAALTEVLRPLPDVLGVRTEPWGEDRVRVVLGVRSGLTREHLALVLHAARALLAEVDLLAERADEVELAVLPA
jgi:hypothetical protein